MRNFRNYDVWIDSVDMSIDIYKITEMFPKSEKYALSDQIQRASVSVPSNIAEGCSRKSEKEFSHYLEMSLGSSYEVETQLEIARRLKYITKEQFDEQMEKLFSIEKRLLGLINSLNSKNQ